MDLSEQTRRRYEERYLRLGRSVRTLGWGTANDQAVRFSQALRLLPPDVSSILDIGCGFGDFLGFLRSAASGNYQYLGWDITPDFVAEASSIYAGVESASFKVVDLLQEAPESTVADCAVMFGLLNYNWKDQANNLQLSKAMIHKALALVERTLVVDFLSSHLCDSYPREDGVYYHDPAEMLAFALDICPSAVLLHDYRAIPQREFMIAFKRNIE